MRDVRPIGIARLGVKLGRVDRISDTTWAMEMTVPALAGRVRFCSLAKLETMTCGFEQPFPRQRIDVSDSC